jgi:DNA-binding protein YbaB
MGIMDSMSRFKTSQRVGERTTAMLQDLSNMSVEGIAANGKVKVTFNGQQKPMAVQIDDDYLQSLLAELVVEDVDDKNTQSSKGNSIQKSNKNVKGATSSAAAAAKELGDVLTEAMQEAHAKSAEKMEEKLKSFYSDLGLSSD